MKIDLRLCTILVFLFTAKTIPAADYSAQPLYGIFKSAPFFFPAWEYDTGGEGVAYHDSDSENQNTNSVRISEGVDLWDAPVAGGGYRVGWTRPGEWLRYSFKVPIQRNYQLRFKISFDSPENTSAVIAYRFLRSGHQGRSLVTPTGGWNLPENMDAGVVNLSEGHETLEVYFESVTNIKGECPDFWSFELL